MEPFQAYLIYSSVALAVIGLGFLLYQYRMKRMRALADRLQSLVEERTAALERLNQELQRLTATDSLTGVANRKHLEERLDIEVAYAIRHGTELSAIMLDVDFFKKVNDTHGHLAGDEVLRNMGALLNKAIRTEDLAARYGGEEFVIVARGIAAYDACLLADRVRAQIEVTTVTFHGKAIRFTSSAGVASLADCGDRKEKAHLLHIADGRLYQAKQGGRNRVVGPA